MSRLMRSLCQEECEADVKINAKPMSRRMRSGCQDECEADVKIMPSRCQSDCEADVEKAFRRAHEYAEWTYTRTQAIANGNKQPDMFLSMCALITSLTSTSSAQYNLTH